MSATTTTTTPSNPTNPTAYPHAGVDQAAHAHAADSATTTDRASSAALLRERREALRSAFQRAAVELRAAAFDVALAAAVPGDRLHILRVRRALEAGKEPAEEDLAVTAETFLDAFEAELGPATVADLRFELESLWREKRAAQPTCSQCQGAQRQPHHERIAALRGNPLPVRVPDTMASAYPRQFQGAHDLPVFGVQPAFVQGATDAISYLFQF